jgi:hypothetical protein
MLFAWGQGCSARQERPVTVLRCHCKHPPVTLLVPSLHNNLSLSRSELRQGRWATALSMRQLMACKEDPVAYNAEACTVLVATADTRAERRRNCGVTSRLGVMPAAGGAAPPPAAPPPSEGAPRREPPGSPAGAPVPPAPPASSSGADALSAGAAEPMAHAANEAVESALTLTMTSGPGGDASGPASAHGASVGTPSGESASARPRPNSARRLAGGWWPRWAVAGHANDVCKICVARRYGLIKSGPLARAAVCLLLHQQPWTAW